MMEAIGTVWGWFKWQDVLTGIISGLIVTVVAAVVIPIVRGSDIWGYRQIVSLFGSKSRFPANPKKCLHARVFPVQSWDGEVTHRVDLFHSVGGQIPYNVVIYCYACGTRFSSNEDMAYAVQLRLNQEGLPVRIQMEG